jgi:protoporphyrinogen oxidase
MVMDQPVVRIEHDANRIQALITQSEQGETRYEAEHFISTMPVRDLVLGLVPQATEPARTIAAALEYRDFVIIGLLYKRLLPTPSSQGPLNLVPDNWIYVQEPGVKVGRLQIFNNWSPYLVRDPDTVWIGMEYFATEGDELWKMADHELVQLGLREMRQLQLADPADKLDSVVIRAPKAYPGYFGSYARFPEVRAYLDSFANLFLVGRNGMHRYNNQDHSMVSARMAAEAILSGSVDKSAIWDVNIGDEYHEGT